MSWDRPLPEQSAVAEACTFIIQFSLNYEMGFNQQEVGVISEPTVSERQKSLAHSQHEFRLFGFTKKHIKILLLYGMANIFRAAIVLINGPFYPPEVIN